jgi:hypothetical protein
MSAQDSYFGFDAESVIPAEFYGTNLDFVFH